MEKKYWRGVSIFLAVYLALSLLFCWIVNEDWQRTLVVTDPVNRDALLPALTGEHEIFQKISLAADRVDSLTLYVNPGTEDRGDQPVVFQLSAGKETLAEGEVFLSERQEDGALVLPVNVEGRKNTPAELKIRGGAGGHFWYGTTRSAGKFAMETEDGGLSLNGTPMQGQLEIRQRGLDNMPYMKYYWPAVILLGVIIISVLMYMHFCRVKGKQILLNRFVDLVHQYQYLLKTLVIRDFRVKYKASVLGVLWSFLNPLLMTLVYMFVFSKIFNSSIEHFVAYLMSGIVLFNYFSESTNLGMQSIVGNAGLITKVYMPKYILPISKAFSSAINLVISMIPLMIMMALTGVPFHRSLLLIPLLLVLLICFCIGVALILSAAMVYFRDTQFLWGIMLTVWNFLSPIFYPESIIPERFITLYHVNPLYQYLFFMRTITVGGISPTPVTYLYCGLWSAAALLTGILVFRKTQSKFVLHL